MLQVAEDLANLTPVRLDVLLALAPMSPTATSAENPLGKENESSQKKLKQEDKEIDDTSSKVSSSLYPEEEEEEEELVDANAAGEEFIVTECVDNETLKNIQDVGPKSTKRVASGSFDQSMTKVPSHVVKKKKPTKASEAKIREEIEEKPTSSGYASEATTASSKASSKHESQKQPHEATHEPSPAPSSKIGTASSSSIISSLPSQGFFDIPCETSQTLSNASFETITSKDLSVKEEPKNEHKEKSNKSDDLKIETEAKQNKTEENSEPVASSESNVSAVTKKSIPKPSADSVELNSGSNKRRESIERRSSVNQQVGKVSYPKFIENTNEAEKKPSSSIHNKISDAKKVFEIKKDNVVNSKVSSAKQVFERRSSTPTAAPLWKNAGERKTSLLEGTSESKAQTKKEKKNFVQEAESKNLKPCDVLEASKKLLENVNKKDLPKDDLKIEFKNDDNKSKTIIDEAKRDTKDATKQVSKTKIEVVRQCSVESRESVASAPELKDTSDNSNRTTFQLKDYVPFVKDEQRPSSVRSFAEIKLGPQTDTSDKVINERTFDFDSDNEESPKVTTSTPTTPSIVPTKAAPITRSYKKVTFTKDGKCITETGKIISEEGADGSFTRLEKKSKVTHYPTGGQSSSTTTEETTEKTTRTVKNYGGGTLNDSSRLGSISPPLIHSGLRKSESTSSSGSTDIFDDIFDTWSGDPSFSNLTGRMKSLLQERVPFSSLWGSNKKKTKKKSRAESCERKLSNDWRKTGHGTDQELSDTDNEDETGFGMSTGGLWKYLSTKTSSSKIFDRQQSLLSKHFGPDHDFFREGENFSTFTRSTSRTSQTPSLRMVINPGGSKVFSSIKTIPAKQDSTESNESGGSETYIHSYSNKGQVRSTSRKFSRETNEPFVREDYVIESEERPSSIKRVEQWLDMSKDDDLDINHPITMYTTLRPRTVTRFGRSVSTRTSGEDGGKSILESGNNKSFSATQKFHITSTSGDRRDTNKPSSSEVIHIPISRSVTGRAKPVIHMKLSLGGPRINHISSDNSYVNTFTETSSTPPHPSSSSPHTFATSSVTSSPEMLTDWDSPLILPESSSLLEQLRTHGYRNMVSQRLSGGGGLGERYENQETTSSSPPRSNKRGKSLNQDSSSNMGTACVDLNSQDDNIVLNCMRRKTNNDTVNSLFNIEQSVVNSPQPLDMYSKPEHEKENLNQLKSINAYKKASETKYLLTPSFDAKNEKINKWSNLNRRSMINSFINPDPLSTNKETLQERIFRKSYYSRFNNDNNVTRTTSRRRSSLLDDDINSYLKTKYSLNLNSDQSSALSSNLSASNALAYDKSSKPPICISNDQFIQRMQTRAQQLIEEARERQRFALNHLMRRGRERVDHAFSDRRRSQSMNREEDIRRSEYTLREDRLRTSDYTEADLSPKLLLINRTENN